MPYHIFHLAVEAGILNLYTLTPNPVLDISGNVEKIIPNEKVYVKNEMKSAGGNGVNVARTIRKLGIPVIATGFLGGGVGKEVEDLIESDRVRSKFVWTRETTRINVSVS